MLDWIMSEGVVFLFVVFVVFCWEGVNMSVGRWWQLKDKKMKCIDEKKNDGTHSTVTIHMKQYKIWF